MVPNLHNTTKARIFYLLAIGHCTLVALLAVLLDKPNEVGVVLFTPMAATLLMLCVITRDGYGKISWLALGLQRMGWLAAVFLLRWLAPLRATTDSIDQPIRLVAA